MPGSSIRKLEALARAAGDWLDFANSDTAAKCEVVKSAKDRLIKRSLCDINSLAMLHVVKKPVEVIKCAVARASCA